jgi:multidrug efflux pump subunit AcrA (membrane-fusion protein)
MKYLTQLPQVFQSLWNKKRSRLAMLWTGVLCLVAVLSLSVYAAMQSGTVSPTLAQTGSEEESDTSTELKTINPTLVSGSSSVILLGTVLSHETANIYPRRDGIIEDVYVDIGDTVRKNQVVALLLPKGVEGQSAAMIAEKQARKSQAESDLSTAEQVAQETVINTRQKINEKETELMIAKREQETIVQKFAESEAKISQMREQAFTAIQNTRQLIEWITLGSNSRSGIEMRDSDVLKNLGIHDASNSARYDIVYTFNALYAAEQEYTSASSIQKPAVIDRLIPLALDALGTTNTLLQFTPTEPSANGIDQLSHAQLTDQLSKVVSAQDMIYKAKEKLENVRNSFQSLVSGEPELYRAYRSGNYEGANSNKVRMVQEQIRTAHNALGLTEANQVQIIESKQSMVEIADAMLRSEYATSGNRQILSPFSGTVSKRFIDVGQIVMPSMSAFELTGVPTSLAKKAKTEIQFGLPEQLIGALDIGDTVTFFLQSDETTPYSAEVTRKSPQVDMQTHTITIQAKVPDDLSLPHGSSVRIRLIDAKKPIFRIPSSSVKREADRNYVWVMDKETKKPMQSTVSVIAEDGEFAEVTGVITTESLLILDPPSQFTTSEENSNSMP